MCSKSETNEHGVYLKSLTHPPCGHPKFGRACSVCIQLTELEVESQHLRSQFLEIQAKHQELLTERNAAHDRFSRLPIELGWRILAECCEPFDTHSASPQDYDACGRTMAGVCKAWRCIALQTSFLWKSLSLDLHRIKADFEAILERRVALSGQLRLSVVVCTSAHYVDDATKNAASDANRPQVLERARQLAHFICAHFGKIASLVIKLPLHLLASFHGVQIAGSHVLDEIHVHRTDFRNILRERQSAPPITFGESVCSQKVCTYYFSPALLDIKWEEVEEVSMQGDTMSSCFNVLSRAQQASMVFLEFRGDNGSAVFPSAPFLVRSVKSLRVDEAMTLYTTFRTTIMPSLTMLDIRSISRSDLQAFQPTIIQFVGHCANNLTVFKIDITDFDSSDFIAILDHLPNITDLTISVYDYQPPGPALDEVIKRLRIRSPQLTGSFVLLTKLRKLSLSANHNLEWDALIDLAMSRMEDYVPSEQRRGNGGSRIATLQSVEYEVSSLDPIYLDRALIQRIDELQQSGCEFSLRRFWQGPRVDIVEESKKHLEIA